jgi:hypothetical protein
MAHNYTVNNNPFYNEVDPGVRGELSHRSGIYSARARGTSDSDYIHSWLFRKSAYVTISYNGNVILEPPKRGFDDMYKNGLFPPAVVNGVTISNEGDFGSLLKAEIRFSVYTLGQLTSFTQNLLSVKAGPKNEPIPVTIKYGWTLGSDGPAEQFYGYVVNYNWSLRADGGFDCVSNLVGEGFASVFTKANAPVPGDPPANTAGNETVSPANWIRALHTYDYKEKGPLSSVTLTNKVKISVTGPGFVLLELKVDEDGAPNKPDANISPVSKKIKYVTLEFICAAVNATLKSISKNFKDHEYICDGTISNGWLYEDLVSSDPKSVIFPGQSGNPGLSTYGDQNIVDINLDMKSGKIVDLSKILISTDYLNELLTKMTETKTATTNFKNVDVTVANLFKNIFEKIDSCSGGLYKLTLTAPQTKERAPSDLNKWIVLDTLYVPGTATICTIPVIASSGKGYSGIARSVSMTSKLPGAMAAAQFVSAASTLTDASPALIGVQTNTPVVETKPLQDVIAQLQNNARAALKNGFTTDDIANIEASLSEYKLAKAPPDSKDNWRQGFPIPIELSITLDGIKGFRFGNTIKIDYLPAGYENVVFTVTKIVHVIENNDWTTQLSTVCRIKV